MTEPCYQTHYYAKRPVRIGNKLNAELYVGYGYPTYTIIMKISKYGAHKEVHTLHDRTILTIALLCEAACKENLKIWCAQRGTHPTCPHHFNDRTIPRCGL